MRTRLLLMVGAAVLGLAVGYGWRRVSPTLARGDRSGASPAALASGGRPREASGPARPADDSPLATRLERELAKTSGVDRWLLWSQVVEQAQPTDFPRLARLAQDDPAVLQFVAARWAELAPRQFFDTLVAATQGRVRLPLQPLARVLFEEWPKTDPEGAIAALSGAVTFGMRSEWRSQVATTVINQDIERGLRLFAEWHIESYLPFSDGRGPVPQWAAADPRHAAETLLQYPSSYLSQEALKIVGEEWGKSDAAAALGFATAIGGQPGSLLGTAALKTWAERDLTRAADWLAAADEPVRNRLGPGFIEAWAKTDPAGALAWSEENLAGSSLSRAATAAVEGAGVKQVTTTAALVAAMDPSPARAEAALAVARQWFPSLGGMGGPSGAQTVAPQAVAWLQSLDPLSIKRVLDEETWQWATSDPSSMAGFLLTMTNPAIGTWPDTCLARQLARQNPAEALDWASQLSGNRALTAGSEAYAEWRNAQPEAASRWLNELPPDDPRRQPFFAGAIRQLAYNSQEQVAQSQLAAMNAQDRAAARTVIEGMTSLPDERRARLLAGLKN